MQYEGYPRKIVNDGIKAQIATTIRNGAVENGILFQAFHRQTILAGATFDISFTTPVDKDIRAFPSVIVSSVDKVTFQYFEGATTIGGTALTPFAQNRQLGITSGVSMKQGVTTTATGIQIAQAWLPGSTGVGQSRSGSLSGGGETFWKLKRNTTYVLRFINGSTESNAIQLNEIWVEGM